MSGWCGPDIIQQKCSNNKCYVLAFIYNNKI